VFVPGKPFQTSLTFESKAAAYPSEAPIMCSTLRYAPGHTSKRTTKLERIATDKHSSLLKTFINYGREKVYKIGTNFVIIKL